MRIVDVHAHFYPREYLTFLGRVVGSDSSVWGRAAQFQLATRLEGNRRMVDINAHLEHMDEAGVEVEVLSLSIPHPYFDDEKDAVDACKLVNDTIAEMCVRFPTQFKGLAVLPLPHADAALKELDRAIDTLNLHGVTLGGNVKGAYLDDARFRPIYREVNRRHLAIHMHPMIPPGQEEMGDYGLAPSMGYLLDTALGTLRLAHAGVFAENPDMKLIVPHLGTFLLSAWDRIQSSTRESGLRGPSLAETLRGLYYDSVNLHRPTWDAALRTIDVSQVVFGTDYPFTAEGSTQRGIALVNSLDVTEEQRENIFHGTADTLFA